MDYRVHVVVAMLFTVCNGQITDEAAMRTFLAHYNTEAAKEYNNAVKISWNYYTNITDENLEKMTQSELRSANFTKMMAAEANKYNWKGSSLNDTEKRQFKKITEIGFSAVEDTSKIELKSRLEAELTGIYSKGEVCLNNRGCLQLEPGLTDVLTGSRNYAELLEVWKGWRDQTGKLMRGKYTEFVNVMNDAIKSSGYNDTGEYWRSWYEAETFETDVRNLYNEFRPLYEQLHAYVRRKLKDYYGEDLFPKSGHIPAHLFGNMWSQSWINIYDLLTPYPNAVSVDITQKMKDLGYNVTHMYRVAEEFFTSIGLDTMPDGFWVKSMLVKPSDRDVVCHASAWDFYDGNDFRIKQCTSVTGEQFLTVHHEMGHVIYFLDYKDQPVIFRDGANPGMKNCLPNENGPVPLMSLPRTGFDMGNMAGVLQEAETAYSSGAPESTPGFFGFHEGMADIVSLSFQTPEHMKAIGLLDEIPSDTESDINFLMQMALEKIAFLPFGYLIDQWRWSVFRGDTTPQNYTASWWDLRCGYQGISPPVQRTEEDFDPGAKYHIPGNTPYIRYFVSFVVQFQWHKALCDEIGYKGPLHRCDIYRNKTAGAKLRRMLELGSSRPWQDAMEVITGGRSMSALPLVEYFRPLIDWLTEQNKEENIGWSKVCPSKIPQASTSTNSASHFLLPFGSLLTLLIFVIDMFF